MNKFSFSSKSELDLFFKTEKFNKILVICGEKSYKLSGANKIIDEILVNVNTRYYFKKFAHTNTEELNLIINKIKQFSPDLIVAVGGGSVLDYAKIANVLTNNDNLNKEIINSSYKIFEKFQIVENNFRTVFEKICTINLKIYLAKKYFYFTIYN